MNVSQQTQREGLESRDRSREEGAKVMPRQILCPNLTKRVMVPTNILEWAISSKVLCRTLQKKRKATEVHFLTSSTFLTYNILVRVARGEDSALSWCMM